MTKQEILTALEAEQMIQMRNPPTSSKWQDASDNIHRLVKMLTGKPFQDACGAR